MDALGLVLPTELGGINQSAHVIITTLPSVTVKFNNNENGGKVGNYIDIDIDTSTVSGVAILYGISARDDRTYYFLNALYDNQSNSYNILQLLTASNLNILNTQWKNEGYFYTVSRYIRFSNSKLQTACYTNRNVNPPNEITYSVAAEPAIFILFN